MTRVIGIGLIIALMLASGGVGYALGRRDGRREAFATILTELTQKLDRR
jgi:UPF0716 family protein affecting phage T7 exclusion